VEKKNKTKKKNMLRHKEDSQSSHFRQLGKRFLPRFNLSRKESMSLANISKRGGGSAASQGGKNAQSKGKAPNQGKGEKKDSARELSSARDGQTGEGKGGVLKERKEEKKENGSKQDCSRCRGGKGGKKTLGQQFRILSAYKRDRKGPTANIKEKLSPKKQGAVAGRSVAQKGGRHKNFGGKTSRRVLRPSHGRDGPSKTLLRRGGEVAIHDQVSLCAFGAKDM